MRDDSQVNYDNELKREKKSRVGYVVSRQVRRDSRSKTLLDPFSFRFVASPFPETRGIINISEISRNPVSERSPNFRIEIGRRVSSRSKTRVKAVSTYLATLFEFFFSVFPSAEEPTRGNTFFKVDRLLNNKRHEGPTR